MSFRYPFSFKGNSLLKKEGKYALCNLQGEIILNWGYDKIKKMGEYIIIKKNNNKSNYKNNVINKNVVAKVFTFSIDFVAFCNSSKLVLI